MRSLQWTTSNAVFVNEMDDEHKEIYQALSLLQKAIATSAPPSDLLKPTQNLIDRIESHLAHEERLMRAARYDLLRWHKSRHDVARRRVTQYVRRIEREEAGAASELVDYVGPWLHDHTRVADMMLGAFLRNHRRGVCKVTFQAGTKPIDACDWVDARGELFDPGSES